MRGIWWVFLDRLKTGEWKSRCDIIKAPGTESRALCNGYQGANDYRIADGYEDIKWFTAGKSWSVTLTACVQSSLLHAAEA